jgi:isoquinoline 1-oxidoreductase beta subunit
MEPMNCTARVADGKVDIWAPTQVPQLARAAAAKVAGVDVAQVTLHQTLLGGGFGRRLEVDSVAQAVQIAMATQGKPVQLIWSREEDTQHDFYRPMNVALLRAGFDKNKAVISLRVQSAGEAITPHFTHRHFASLPDSDSPDKPSAEGLCDIPYGFGNQKMSHSESPMGVPVGFWRSVGHSHNAFFSECFVDEMAESSGLDPLAFRREWLADAPRHLKVLNLAAAKANWGAPLPAGHAHGLALHHSFGSIVAQVAEVSLEKGVLRVHRVVCAMDCGTVVNPGIVAQQVESSVVFALSAALYGKIDIVGGVVQQSSFSNYPLLQLAQTPHVDTYLVDSERDPTGVGEPAVPPLAPAVANAMFALTGKRQRSLPLVA